MQSLATELGIAETAFVTPTDAPGTFDLRWFSPLVEIDLCGHATLASAHALRAHGVVDGTTPVTFRHPERPAEGLLRRGSHRARLPGRPMTEAPAARARCRANGTRARSSAPARTSFFAVVVLASEAAVRQLPARPRRHRRHRPPRRSSSPRPPTPAPGPTTCCGSSGPTWGSTRTRPPARPSAWPVPTGRPSSGGPRLVARQLSPRGAVLYVRPDGRPGAHRRATPSRCSRATCAKS